MVKVGNRHAYKLPENEGSPHNPDALPENIIDNSLILMTDSASIVTYHDKQGKDILVSCQITKEIMGWMELHAVEISVKYISRKKKKKKKQCDGPVKPPQPDYSHRVVTSSSSVQGDLLKI